MMWATGTSTMMLTTCADTGTMMQTAGTGKGTIMLATGTNMYTMMQATVRIKVQLFRTQLLVQAHKIYNVGYRYGYR